MRYSGGGTTVMQQLLMDVSGKAFPQLVRETVLEPAGMNDSTYEQPLPVRRAAQAASGHHAGGDVVKGRWHVYPEMAAAGLWTTPTDLARFAVEIAWARNGKSKLLSADTARQMLAPQIEETTLGFFTSKHNLRQFGHGGANQGFQALLIAFADTGQGAAIMTNSDNGGRLAGMLADRLAAEFGWNYARSKPSIALAMLPLVTKRGAAAAISAYHQLKRDKPDTWLFDEYQLNSAGLHFARVGRHADAIAMLELNAKIFPDSWRSWCNLGESYAAAGDTARGIAAYEKCLTINPQHPSAPGRLAKLRAETPARR